MSESRYTYSLIFEPPDFIGCWRILIQAVRDRHITKEGTMTEQTYFSPGPAASYDMSRAKQHAKGIVLAYDCYNCRIHPSGRAICRKGNSLHPQSRNGDIALITVLKGRTLPVCQGCADYDD
jgi:hypothetical protein